MKDFLLSEEQVNELRAAHRAERNRQAAYKINAVILLGTGWKLNEVKEALLLDPDPASQRHPCPSPCLRLCESPAIGLASMK